MSEEQQTSYDIIPYQSDPFPQTHPGVLATIGILFGMQTVPVEKCRVLEIACAGGGNLIPMALELPGSEFVGIDLSARQIKQAKETAEQVGLKNIRFEKKDILELNEDFGKFDYIIAHGVYSWVPNAVADRILEVCKKN